MLSFLSFVNDARDSFHETQKLVYDAKLYYKIVTKIYFSTGKHGYGLETFRERVEDES